MTILVAPPSPRLKPLSLAAPSRVRAADTSAILHYDVHLASHAMDDDTLVAHTNNASNTSQKRPATEDGERPRGKRAKYTSAAWYVHTLRNPTPSE
jgi:hypothetical protein